MNQNKNKKNILMEKFNILLKKQIVQSESLYLKKNPHEDLVYNSALSILNFIEKEFNKKKFLFFVAQVTTEMTEEKLLKLVQKKFLQIN